MKTYDLHLECGKTVSLRLTSRAISAFIKEHGINGAAPLVSVINAANSMEATIALLTAAMRYPGAVQDMSVPTGAELIDLLADEGRGDVYLKRLVVQLALDAGLLDGDAAAELAQAMADNSGIVVSQMAKLLRQAGDGGETSDGEEPEENPM